MWNQKSKPVFVINSCVIFYLADKKKKSKDFLRKYKLKNYTILNSTIF